MSTEKNVLAIFLKKHIVSKIVSEETRRSFEPVGTNPSIMYGLYEVHKDIIDYFLPFWLILSAYDTPFYKIMTFLANILKPTTTFKLFWDFLMF